MSWLSQFLIKDFQTAFLQQSTERSNKSLAAGILGATSISIFEERFASEHVFLRQAALRIVNMCFGLHCLSSFTTAVFSGFKN